MRNRPPGERVRGVLSRRSVSIAGTVLVVLGTGAIAARTVDLGLFARTLTEADPGLVIAATLAYALSWPVRGVRYGAVLRAMGHRCGRPFLTAAVFVSQTANLVVPARAGDAGRAYLLKRRRGIEYATGAASLLVERAFDLAALATIGGLAAALVQYSGRPVAAIEGVGPEATGAAAVGAGAIAVGATALLLAGRAWSLAAVRVRLGDSVLTRGVDAIAGVWADVRVVVADGSALGRIYATSLVVWGLDVLTAVVVLAAVVDRGGSGLSVAGLLAVGALAVSVGNLAKVIPVSQGGLGLYEAAFAGVVVGLTPIAAGAALAAAVLDHLLKNVVTLAGGAVAGLALGLSPTLLENSGERPEPGTSDP